MKRSVHISLPVAAAHGGSDYFLYPSLEVENVWQQNSVSVKEQRLNVWSQAGDAALFTRRIPPLAPPAVCSKYHRIKC